MDDSESKRLMFDDDFRRSKVYFESLQILRIFGQVIRETGRGMRGLHPEIASTSGWGMPDIDKIALDNWKILWDFYLEKEKHFLQRIAEKTEEIEGLRGGVSRRPLITSRENSSRMLTLLSLQLFNATALREASRSTTMNRYIIVFTIVTVLYLPPSLIAVQKIPLTCLLSHFVLLNYVHQVICD